MAEIYKTRKISYNHAFRKFNNTWFRYIYQRISVYHLFGIPLSIWMSNSVLRTNNKHDKKVKIINQAKNNFSKEHVISQCLFIHFHLPNVRSTNWCYINHRQTRHWEKIISSKICTHPFRRQDASRRCR